MTDYVKEIERAYQAVEKDTSLSKSIREKKIEALCKTAAFVLNLAEHSCYDPLILEGYAKKKSHFILNAQSCGEIDEIMAPSKPYYDGNKFRDRKYQVDEEELIDWCQASLRVPLNSAATERMLALMCRVFPKERLKSIKEFDLQADS